MILAAATLPFLDDFVVIFGAALLVIAASHRLKLPPLVGFLITGMLVGPSGLALVSQPEHVETLAELGVVFLLFTIGLEISIDRLRKLGRSILTGGGIQVGLTALAGTGTALLLGAAPAAAVFAGFVVALSSTAIVLKLYQERRELEAPNGRTALGILLFQDFLVVPLLLVVPILAGRGGGLGALVLRFGGGLLLVALAFVLGRYLLPVVLGGIVRTRVRELFVIGSLFACLGSAWLMEALGFSLALGAFLAGILIAESDYHHQALAEIAPFRDVFNSLFFISVGMLLHLGTVAEHLTTVLLLTAAVLAVKIPAVALAARGLGFPLRVGLIAGLGLAQIGEFSLVLLKAGHRDELVPTTWYQIAIATSVLTMLLTPLWIALAPRIATRVTTWLGDRSASSGGTTLDSEEGGEARRRDHVIVAGLGLNGRNLMRVLRQGNIPHLGVDLSANAIRKATERGDKVIYGDITRRDIQEGCGMAEARIAVFVLSDPIALRQALPLARQLNPNLYILARTRQLSEIEELQKCGADEVVAEEFETSIELVTHVLGRLHLPGNVIRAQARLLREDGYQMLRSPTTSGLSERMVRALASGTTDTFQLLPEHAACGQSLRQLDLRKRSGASVLAVVRNDKPHSNPDAKLILAADDTLVLMGSHAEIEAAFAQLQKRKTQTT